MHFYVECPLKEATYTAGSKEALCVESLASEGHFIIIRWNFKPQYVILLNFMKFVCTSGTGLL